MRLAVYAGTFDPITCGHLSVIRRAARMFDRLIVLVAVNPDKRPVFPVEERLAMIRESVAISNVDCASTTGYVVQYARDHGATYLVRGVRTSTDAESEIALASLNFSIAPEVETVFIPAEPGLSEVSSSRLKELAASGSDISEFCPAPVAQRMFERLGHPAAREETVHV